MCDKCAEYDHKIARYRRLAAEVMDEIFNRNVDRPVSEMTAERAKLHPEDRERKP
jgi:hypothetical protein